MFETHISKDGVTVLVCQMDSKHLSNTIKAYCREIEKCRKVVNQPSVENQMIAIFNSNFSQSNLKEQAVKQLKIYHERLQPYLGEALLRGLNLSNELKIAYGRTGQIKNAFCGITLELIQGDDDDDDGYEDDYSHPGHPSHYGDR
ncbi:hypothetical protein [Nostoc sp. UHCC 0252]|uniref:hypothetical protein n=1 Tax=Nostoc sp. UHCC 0252 TaxID=3110241 RepID=UPI002B21A8D7|nr:hypothetical protein [Nostoc sp. UHCC 0252]MEA5603208.1 hypothetical protein [Nostoc sp. UHCC 0252]